MLTKGAEALLQEIITNRADNGVVNPDCFFKKLDAMNSADSDLYRSCFKELEDNNLVKTFWADNGPYMISLTSVGLEYFKQKEIEDKEEKKEKRNARLHDVLIAAIGAVFGGIVTFILFKLFGIS